MQHQAMQFSIKICEVSEATQLWLECVSFKQETIDMDVISATRV
jgi:hypothetical protein